MLPILLSLLIGVAGVTSDKDAILEAMSDELDRSMQQLQLEKHKKPYYISYRIEDKDRLDMNASFGSITKDNRTKRRALFVDVHIGNYNLDSGNMPKVWSSLTDYDSVTLDNNYDAIRHALWLETDKTYKSAVQNLERKEAILQEKMIKNRPDDWSHEQVVVEIQPKVSLTSDRAAWKNKIRNLSAIFKNYPLIRQSSVSFADVIANSYFINNEGSKSRTGQSGCWLSAKATAQGEDGIKVNDSMLVIGIDDKHLPSMNELESKINDLAVRVSKAVTSNDAEVYQGPILLQGEAAAEFFSKALVPYVGIKRDLDTSSAKRLSNPLQDRIGKRIMPSFISVIDDPTLTDSNGVKAPGSYDIDDQGVRAQKVELINKGILKTLLSTRLPTSKVKNSNGHAYGKNAEASNLIVQTDESLSPEELKAKLIKLGKDDGLEYVLLVRKLSSSSRQDSFDPTTLSFIAAALDDSSKNKVTLPAPVDISKVFVSDGHEESLKGAEFESCTLRVLKDIVAAGNDPKVYYFQQAVSTITTPSIILENIEIQKSNSDSEKLPILKHPYFEKQANKN